MADRPERKKRWWVGRPADLPADRGRRPLREGDYPLGISLDVNHTPKTAPDLPKQAFQGDPQGGRGRWSNRWRVRWSTDSLALTRPSVRAGGRGGGYDTAR